MAQKKPNTLCKNIHCTKGRDGRRKLFYTCKYCVHTVSNQSVACCDECFHEYMKQVAQARADGKPFTFAEMLPERTDMTASEVMELVMDTATDEVVLETEAELAEELAEEPGVGYGRIVRHINEALDETNMEEGDA